jgi:hypothetical protein
MKKVLAGICFLFILVLISGCDKEEPEENAPKHYIGEFHDGGIIFYLFTDSTEVEHGLIASLGDMSNSSSWGLYLTNVANCESFWDGKSNTSAIVAAGGLATDAAGLCDAYSNEGFSDWYLPAFDELSLLYESDYLITKILDSDDQISTKGMSRGYYWSSTENNSDSGIKMSFLNGSSMADNKFETCNVRAVRSF